MRLKNPFWGYTELAIAAGILLPAVAVVVASLWMMGSAPKAVQAIVGLSILYAVLFAGVYMVLKKSYDEPVGEGLGWTIGPVQHWKAVLVGIMLAVGLSALGIALRTPQMTDPMKELLNTDLGLIVVGLGATTIFPVCEELAFRGFILPLFARSFGVWGGIFLTAFPFALLHGPQYEWHWQHILLLTMAGAAFGWMRVFSQSTITASVMHAAYNMTFMLGYLANQKELSGTW